VDAGQVPRSRRAVFLYLAGKAGSGGLKAKSQDAGQSLQSISNEILSMTPFKLFWQIAQLFQN
jgi:hypothetical protein